MAEVVEATHDLCDKILDKDNKGVLRVKKYSVIHEEVVDLFHKKYYITTIRKISFHIARVRILDSMEYGKTRNDCFHINAFYFLFLNIMQNISEKQPVYKYRVNIGM